MFIIPSYGVPSGPEIVTLKYRILSSYGVALTPSTGSAKSRCVSCTWIKLINYK